MSMGQLNGKQTGQPGAANPAIKFGAMTNQKAPMLASTIRQGNPNIYDGATGNMQDNLNGLPGPDQQGQGAFGTVSGFNPMMPMGLGNGSLRPGQSGLPFNQNMGPVAPQIQAGSHSYNLAGRMGIGQTKFY